MLTMTPCERVREIYEQAGTDAHDREAVAELIAELRTMTAREVKSASVGCHAYGQAKNMTKESAIALIHRCIRERAGTRERVQQ